MLNRRSNHINPHFPSGKPVRTGDPIGSDVTFSLQENIRFGSIEPNVTLASPLKREQQPLIGFLQGGKCYIRSNWI